MFAARPLFRALTATRTLLPAPRPLSPFAVDLPAIVAAPLSSPGTALLPPRFPCPVQLLELFLCEWPVQLLVQRLERLRPGGSARAARHEKAKRPVERRQLGLAQGARELFWESQARDAAEAGRRILHVVVNLDVAVADRYTARQSPIVVAHRCRNERLELGCQIEIGMTEVGERLDACEL